MSNQIEDIEDWIVFSKEWTKEEVDEFFEALNLFGLNWYKISSHVGTKSA